MAGLVVTTDPIENPAGVRFTTGTITFDSDNYPSGGEVLTAVDVGLDSNIDALILEISLSGFVARYNVATGKVLIYEIGGALVLVEIGADDASGEVFPYVAIGR